MLPLLKFVHREQQLCNEEAKIVDTLWTCRMPIFEHSKKHVIYRLKIIPWQWLRVRWKRTRFFIYKQLVYKQPSDFQKVTIEYNSNVLIATSDPGTFTPVSIM